jgi:hypothetical protein
MFNMDEGFNLKYVGGHGSCIEEDDDLEEKYYAVAGEGIGSSGEENITTTRKCPQTVSICLSLDLQVMFMTLDICMDGCLLGVCRCCCIHFMDVVKMGSSGLKMWGFVITRPEFV